MSAREQVGVSGPDYEMDVERGRIRDFARAMSAPLPAFVEGRRPIIPATFLVSTPYTWGYSLERPRGTELASIDHDLSVPLHAEESFVFHLELPRAGDRYRCRSSLEKVASKRGSRGGELTFLTLLTRYWDHRDRLAVEQRSVTVTTAHAPSDEGWEVDLPPYDPVYETLDPTDCFQAIRRERWEELVEGRGPGVVTTGPLLLRDIVRFQGVVGEDNALHHDLAWARKFGYPHVFGLGTHQASLLASYAAHWLDPGAVRSLRARFLSVYWPGDVLSYQGEVTRLGRESQGRWAELRLQCTRANGEVIVELTMKLDFGSVD